MCIVSHQGAPRSQPPNSYQQQAAGTCGKNRIVGGLGLSGGDDLLLPPQGWAASANLLRGGTSGPLSVAERLCWMPAPAWAQQVAGVAPGGEGSPPSWARPASPGGMSGRERKALWHFKNVGNLKTVQGELLWAARGWCPAGPADKARAGWTTGPRPPRRLPSCMEPGRQDLFSRNPLWSENVWPGP